MHIYIPLDRGTQLYQGVFQKSCEFIEAEVKPGILWKNLVSTLISHNQAMTHQFIFLTS